MQEMIVCPTEIRKHIPRLRQIFQTLHEYLIITHEGKPYTSSPPHGTCPHIDDRVIGQGNLIIIIIIGVGIATRLVIIITASGKPHSYSQTKGIQHIYIFSHICRPDWKAVFIAD